MEVTIYTVSEFATKIKRNRSYVYELMRKGLVKPRRTITGSPYFTDEEVKKYYNME